MLNVGSNNSIKGPDSILEHLLIIFMASVDGRNDGVLDLCQSVCGEIKDIRRGTRAQHLHCCPTELLKVHQGAQSLLLLRDLLCLAHLLCDDSIPAEVLQESSMLCATLTLLALPVIEGHG